MKSRLIFLLTVLLMGCGGVVRPPIALAQNTGELLPALPPQFFDNNGNPVASGTLTFYASGTTTPQNIYSDTALSTTLSNPLSLNSAGRPCTGTPCSTEVNIYLQALSYTVVLKNSAGSTLWTRNGVYNKAQLFTLDFATKMDDMVCHASQYTGSPNDEGGKFAACIAVLPSTGGTVDGRGLEGTQAWSVCPFTGITKPVVVILGAGTRTSVTCTVPSNISLVLGTGSIISVNGVATLTINGSLDDSSISQHFAGSGTTSFIGNQSVPYLHARWWGAVGDDSTANATTLQAWVNAAEDSGIPAYLDAGVYRTASQILVTLPASASFTMRGAGEDVSQIKLSGTLGAASTPMFFIDGGASPTESEVYIEGIGFIGNSNIGTGLEIEEVGYKTSLNRILVNGFTGSGIVLDRSTFGINLNLVRSSGNGIWGLDLQPVGGSQGVGEGVVTASKFQANGSCVTGGQVNLGEDASFINFAGNVFYGGVTCYRGVHLDDDVGRIGFYQNSFESIGTDGPAIWSDAGDDVFSITIENNYFECSASTGTVQCLDFESSLEAASITGNFISITTTGSGVIQGISVTGTNLQNIIGNNAFVASGTGTETEYVPADIQRVWLSWSPSGAARASFSAMQNQTWTGGTATGYSIFFTPLSETIASAGIVHTDLDTNSVGYLEVAVYSVGLCTFRIIQGGSVTEMDDAGNVCSATAGGDDFNVYWDAGDARVEIQNSSGAGRPTAVIFRGIP